ncbi:MAG: signal peptidase I [Actinomycetia bacterium]|nr:signal peptidase I [Actinomycetes bacterium]
MGQKKIVKEFLGYLVVVIAAVAISLTIRIFVFEPFIVPTPSMEPTLLVGDKVIVNKLAYRFGEISRGDLVVFNSSAEPEKELVKRAIGLPGEEVTLTNEGQIIINGQPIEETYLVHDNSGSYQNQTYKLGPDQYFVMGDNRKNSLDSRYFGPILNTDIFGELVIIYWPPSRIKHL